MNGVPYWFIFWSGFWILGIGAAVMAGRAAHKSKMKALDILRMYAERGIEPPQMMAEHLMTQPPPQHHKQPGGWKQPSGTGHHLGSFAFSFFMAGAAGGVAWWWQDADKTPEWVFYAGVIAAAAFTMGGIAHLIATIVSGLGSLAAANMPAQCAPAAPPPPPPPPPPAAP